MKYITAAIIIFLWGVFTLIFCISILGLLIVTDEGWAGLVDKQRAVFCGRRYRRMN